MCPNPTIEQTSLCDCKQIIQYTISMFYPYLISLLKSKSELFTQRFNISHTSCKIIIQQPELNFLQSVITYTQGGRAGRRKHRWLSRQPCLIKAASTDSQNCVFLPTLLYIFYSLFDRSMYIVIHSRPSGIMYPVYLLLPHIIPHEILLAFL